MRRSDFATQGTISVLFKQIERLIGYAPGLSVTFVNHNSNIAQYRYHRWIPQVELGINLLAF